MILPGMGFAAETRMDNLNATNDETTASSLQ